MDGEPIMRQQGENMMLPAALLPRIVAFFIRKAPGQ